MNQQNTGVCVRSQVTLRSGTSYVRGCGYATWRARPILGSRRACDDGYIGMELMRSHASKPLAPVVASLQVLVTLLDAKLLPF